MHCTRSPVFEFRPVEFHCHSSANLWCLISFPTRSDPQGNSSLCRAPSNRMFLFSGEREREPVDVNFSFNNKATLHLNSSSTFIGLVEQCRKPPPDSFFLWLRPVCWASSLRKKMYACYVRLQMNRRVTSKVVPGVSSHCYLQM